MTSVEVTMIPSSRAALAFLLALVTLTLAEDKKGICDSNQVPRKRLVCVYRSGTTTPISAINPCLCNHILYEAVTVNDRYELENEIKGDFQSLIELKKSSPSLQTIVTVRGLDSLNYDNITDGTEYVNAAKVFAQNTHLYLERHHLNGVNLDWKYKAFNDTDDVTELGQRLTILVQQLNDTLRNNSKTGANYPVISITVTNRPHLLDSGYDFKNLSRFINFINLPAFRFDHHPNNTIQHPSRLYGIDDIENVDSIVDLLLSEGISKEKLNVGIPTFATTYIMKDVNMSTPGSPAGRIANQSKPVSWILSHSQWCSLREEGNWTIERERDQTAPYAHYGLLWVGFDDETSLKLKSRYVLLRNLGGITVWSINEDDVKGICGNGKFPLLTVIKDVLSGNRKDSDNTIVAASQETAALKVIKRSGLVKRAGELGPNDRFICSRRGYFRHPDDCSLFYRCVKLRTMRERSVVLVYSCPRGLVYDERYEICNWPSWSTPCDGSGEVFPVPRKKFVCPGIGYYQDPENCRWFYYCSYLGVSQPRAYEFRCPFALLGFDEERQACNWRWRVPGCKPMDNQYRSRTGRQGRLPQSSPVASEHTPQTAPPLTSLGPIGPLGAIGSLLRATSSSGLPTRRPFGVIGRLFPQRPTLLSLTTYDSANRPRMTYNFNHRTNEEATSYRNNVTPPIGKTQTNQVEKSHSDKEDDDFSDEIDNISETKPDKNVYFDDKPTSNPSATTTAAHTRKPRPQYSQSKKPAVEEVSEAEIADDQEISVSNSNPPIDQNQYSNGHGYQEQYPRGQDFQDQYSNEQRLRPDFPRHITRPIIDDYGGTLPEHYVDTFRQPPSQSGPGLMVTVQRRPRPSIRPQFYYDDSPYNTLTSRSGPRDFRIKFELLPGTPQYGPESYNAFGRRKGHTSLFQPASSSTPFIRIDFPPLRLGPSRRAFIGDTTHSIDSTLSNNDNSENVSSKPVPKQEPLKYSRAYNMAELDEKSSTPLASDIPQRTHPSQRYIYVTPNGFTNVRPSRFYPFVEVPLSSVSPGKDGNSSLRYPAGDKVQNRDDSTWGILPTLKALMETLSGYATTKTSELPAAERRAGRFGFGARIRGGGKATTAKPVTEDDEELDEDYDETTTSSEDTTTQISMTTIQTTSAATTTTTTTKSPRSRDRSRHSDYGDFSLDPYSVEGRTYRSRGSSRRRGNRRGKSRSTTTQPPTTTDAPTTTELVTEPIVTTEVPTTITPKRSQRNRGRGRGSRGRGRGNTRGNSKGRRRQQIEETTSTEIPSLTQPQTTTVPITTTVVTTITTKNIDDVAFTESLFSDKLNFINMTENENSTAYENGSISDNISVAIILVNKTENVSTELYPSLFNNSNVAITNVTKNESTAENVEENLFNSTNATFPGSESINASSNYTESLNVTEISTATIPADINTSATTVSITNTDEIGHLKGVNDSQVVLTTTPVINKLEDNINRAEVNQTVQNETIKSEEANVTNSTDSAILNSTKKPRRSWDEDFTTPRPEFARRTRTRTRTTRQPSRRRQQLTRERRPTATTTTTAASISHYTNARKYIPQEVTTQPTTEAYNDYDEDEEPEEEDQRGGYTLPLHTLPQGRQFRGPQGGIYSGYHSRDDYAEQHQTPSVRSRPQAPQLYSDEDLEDLSDDDYVEDDYLTDEKKARVRATLSEAPQGRLYPQDSTNDGRNQYTGIGQAQYSIPPPRNGRVQVSYGITTPRPQFSYDEILTRDYSPPDPPQQFKKRIQQVTPNGPYYTVRQYQPATTLLSQSYYPSSQFHRRTDTYVDHSRTFSRRMDNDDENQEKTSPLYEKVSKLPQFTTPSLSVGRSSDELSKKVSERWEKHQKPENKEKADSVHRRVGNVKLDSYSLPPSKVTVSPVQGEKPRSITPPDNIPPEGRTNLPFAVSGNKKNETSNDVIPQIACTRPGLFYHPDDCNKFYECYWDNWIKKFTLHIFECPVKLVFDNRLFGCNSIALGPCEKHKDAKPVTT